MQRRVGADLGLTRRADVKLTRCKKGRTRRSSWDAATSDRPCRAFHGSTLDRQMPLAWVRSRSAATNGENAVTTLLQKSRHQAGFYVSP